MNWDWDSDMDNETKIRTKTEKLRKLKLYQAEQGTIDMELAIAIDTLETELQELVNKQ